MEFQLTAKLDVKGMRFHAAIILDPLADRLAFGKDKYLETMERKLRDMVYKEANVFYCRYCRQILAHMKKGKYHECCDICEAMVDDG